MHIIHRFFHCRKIEKNYIINNRYFKDFIILKFKSYSLIFQESKSWSSPAHFYSVKEITKDLLSLAQSQILFLLFQGKYRDSYTILWIFS